MQARAGGAAAAQAPRLGLSALLHAAGPGQERVALGMQD